MSTTQSRDSYQVQSVDRALTLLKLFGTHSSNLDLATLSRESGLSKPTAFRLLSSLMAAGFVEQVEARGDYRVGSAVQALLARASILSSGSLQGVSARAASTRRMRELRDELNESVCLFIQVGNERMLVHQETGKQTVRTVQTVGETAPLFLTASSRLLLSGMEDSVINAYLERAQPEAHDPERFSRGRIWAHVRAIRRAGFAESVNERGYGGAAIAVPVLSDGKTVAALHVSVPVNRFDTDLRNRILAASLDSAHRMSADIRGIESMQTDAKAKADGR